MHLDRVAGDRLGGPGRRQQQLGDVGDFDRPMFTGNVIELLEDLGGTKHGRLFPLDLDRVVAGRHANPKG